MILRSEDVKCEREDLVSEARMMLGQNKQTRIDRLFIGHIQCAPLKAVGTQLFHA